MSNIAKGMSRRAFLTGAGAVAAGLGLAACGGTTTTTDDDAASSAAATDETTDMTVDEANLITADDDGFVVKASKDATASSNECVIAIEGTIQTMHPMNWSDGNSGNVAYYVYNSLYKYNENSEFIPDAADSYEVSDDACTYTFHIHEGITFTDGEVLNAEAVVTNYKAAIDKDNGWRRRRMFIKTLSEDEEEVRVDDVYAVDEYTVAFHLVKPYAPFMNSVTQFYLVSPKAVVDSSYDYAAESAGSGPFKLEEYATGDHTTLVRNDNFWGEMPSIEKVTFKEVPEAGTRIAMLQTGEAQVIYPMPTDQVSTIKEAGDISMKSVESTTMRYVTLNTNVEALSDVRVRQAMNYAFDQDAYCKVMYSGAATPADSILPHAVVGYAEQTPYEFDLEKAKSLMEEAGYPDGFTVEIIGDNSTQETKGMTFVMQQMAQIGITVDVQPNEAATNAEIAALPEDEATVQMWYVNWSQYDADGFLRSLLGSSMVPPTGYNTAFWKNDEFDEELEAGNSAPTVEEQNEHYAKCQEIAWEACPWLFLASDNYLYSYKSSLDTMKYVPQGIDVINSKLTVA